MKNIAVFGGVWRCLAVFAGIFLVSCGGGGSPSVETRDNAPSVRLWSCDNCSQSQLIALRSFGANVADSEQGGVVTVQLTLTRGQHARLASMLDAGRITPTNPALLEKSPGNNAARCHLEYEYGRYEYECDDNSYAVTLPSDGSPRCYYEYEHGRREYECENDRYVVPPRPGTATLTPPYPNPLGCYWDEDEYECYYSDGRECEYEHGRWECEYEHISRSAPQHYYKLPEKNGGGTDGTGLPFLRGYLNDLNAARIDNFLFAVGDGLENLHLEYRMTPVKFGEILFFSDGGYRLEKVGQTAAYYGEITGVYSADSDIDIYARSLAGGVNSDYYKNSRLLGFATGVFARNVFRRGDEWHAQLHRPSADADLSEWKFSADARIAGTKRDDIRLHLWRDFTGGKKGASVFYVYDLAGRSFGGKHSD